MRHDRFDAEASIPLVMDWNGRLYNGRHRLAAQEDEGRTYQYWLHVCSPELALRIQTLGDAPAAWNTADELKVNGEINTFVLAAALSHMYRFMHPGTIKGKQSPTPSYALRLLEANKDLREWVSLPATVANRLKISRAMCGWLAYTTSRLGATEDDIKEFWSTFQLLASPDPIKVAEGASKRGSGPISVYVNWLRRTEPKKGQALRRSDSVVWANLHLTWNAWVTGSKLSVRALNWDPDSSKFPGVANAQGEMLEPGSEEARKLFGGDEDTAVSDQG